MSKISGALFSILPTCLMWAGRGIQIMCSLKDPANERLHLTPTSLMKTTVGRIHDNHTGGFYSFCQDVMRITPYTCHCLKQVTWPFLTSKGVGKWNPLVSTTWKEESQGHRMNCINDVFGACRALLSSRLTVGILLSLLDRSLKTPEGIYVN